MEAREHLDPLKPKQKKFLIAILGGQSIREAAKTIGVTFETARTYYHNGYFRRALDIESARLYEINFSLLVGLTGKAIERVAKVLDDTEAPNRDVLRAAELVLNFSSKYREDLVMSRLEKLEAAIDKQHQENNHVSNGSQTN